MKVLRALRLLKLIRHLDFGFWGFGGLGFGLMGRVWGLYLLWVFQDLRALGFRVHGRRLERRGLGAGV